MALSGSFRNPPSIVELSIKTSCHALKPKAPSVLVVSRLFGFAGRLIQNGDSANPALRFSFSVGRLNILP